jgi:hypothetical protein
MAAFIDTHPWAALLLFPGPFVVLMVALHIQWRRGRIY